MDWNTLAVALFGDDHGITQDGDLLRGTVRFDGEPLAVIGTTNHAPIGVRLALAQARAVLDTVAQHPGRAILLLIDTQGQQLRRRDEVFLRVVETAAVHGPKLTANAIVFELLILGRADAVVQPHEIE